MFLLFIVEQRSQARSGNSTILGYHADIEPLFTDAGIVPANFPQNLSELRTATADVINGLLTAYNQPINGNLYIRKERLAKYLGIRMVFMEE